MPANRVVLAEYFTAEDRTLLFIVREDFLEPEVFEIPIGTKAIQEFVKKHFQEERKEIEIIDVEGKVVKESRVVKSTTDKVLSLDEEAYQAFLAPFVAPLWVCRLPSEDSPNKDLMTEKNDIIWLVPHNFLHYLPLHTVKVGDEYLIERNPVCYTPSASVMKYCHNKRKNKREKVLILADSREDRVHTQEQGMTIEALFAPDAELYVGKSVTKAQLKQTLEEKKESIDILHIACHGEFNANQALQSGILFAQDEKLTAEEIFGLEMRTDLVTLSACESGINENKPGDELIGLTRALIYAGTPSVIVSLWSVDEISTSILMEHFYKKFKSGMEKVEALRQAQLELRRMTIQDVINYCEAAKTRMKDSTTPNVLELDIADMHHAAGDYEAAKACYEQLRRWFRPDGEHPDQERYDRARNGVYRCDDALEDFDRPSKDYDKCIYNQLYCWAPFILVGDWR